MSATLKELSLFILVVVFSVIVFYTGQTVSKMQDEMVNQEAYFYGLSCVMEESNTVHAINHEEKLYEMESQFWGVHFN